MSSYQIEDIYPLAPMQQGMLFHSLYTPEDGLYFIQVSCTLTGNLDAVALVQAWQRVVDRHSALRTTFIWEDLDEPLQVVHRQVKLRIEMHDWRESARDLQEDYLNAWLKADRQRGFDLSKAPLMRLALIRLADDVHQLVWSYHHLLMDGWFMTLFIKEAFACYEALTQGQEIQLAPARPYRDYIEWLKQQSLPAAEAYWRGVLKNFPMPTRLQIKSQAAPHFKQATNFTDCRVQLSVEATAALLAMIQQHRLTLNTVVQGAWALLLSRYSNESDIVFGTTVAGRPADLSGIESMIGLFINTLPMRVRIPPQMSVIAWLQMLQSQQVETRQYEYSPLVQVQSWSDVLPGQVLFETILVFENYPVSAQLQKLSGGLTVSNPRVLDYANYPIIVVAMPGQKLSLRILYNTERFDADTIERMLGHLQTVLESFSSDPEQPVFQVPLLTAAEQERQLVIWNDTASIYPSSQCIHQLFEVQAAQRPQAVALLYNDERLTYEALNQRANQLAYYLRTRCVGPEVLVGICMERSFDLVVGLLGILKAGGAYVPLDPMNPKERLAFLLEDTQVSCVVTQQAFVDRLPAFDGQIICLDADWQTIAQQSTQNPPNQVSADNLACIYYTSGSTGIPKGVQARHKGTIRTFFGVDYIQFDSTQVFLQLAPISWDGLTLELWGALLSGGRCVLYPERIAMPEDLGYIIQQQGITTLWLTASLFNMVVDEAPQALSSLQQLMVGGEALSFPHVQRARMEMPTARIINGYGPAESTVFACCYRIPPRLEAADSSIPIGRPIANTQVYLLDSYFRPVPVGVAGEICIGGDGLARGYLNRPDLTAERFIPNPFGTIKRKKDGDLAYHSSFGDRLYRTGDLARYLPDGNIEFLGRVDQQVKIRGYRVEPSEVQAALAQHPSVQTAVVLAKTDISNTNRLVAFLVPNCTPAPASNELRSFLIKKLPEYMIPSSFVLLDTLPLTPTGKVDRQTLSGYDITISDRIDRATAPHTSLELRLAEIWRQVLGIEHVDIHNDFFMLGGHSLLAIQLVARINEAFQVGVSLRDFFEEPTLAALAVLVAQNLAARNDVGEVDRMLSELEQLSEDEARALRDQETEQA